MNRRNLKHFRAACAWPFDVPEARFDDLPPNVQRTIGRLDSGLARMRKRLVNSCAAFTKAELIEGMADAGCSAIAHHALLHGAFVSAGSFMAALEKARNDRRHGALQKLMRDPKQAAKKEAFKAWKDWQAGRVIHKSQAAFARFIVDTFPTLENPKSVERWAKEWREAKATK